MVHHDFYWQHEGLCDFSRQRDRSWCMRCDHCVDALWLPAIVQHACCWVCHCMIDWCKCRFLWVSWKKQVCPPCLCTEETWQLSGAVFDRLICLAGTVCALDFNSVSVKMKLVPILKGTPGLPSLQRRMYLVTEVTAATIHWHHFFFHRWLINKSRWSSQNTLTTGYCEDLSVNEITQHWG